MLTTKRFMKATFRVLIILYFVFCYTLALSQNLSLTKVHIYCNLDDIESLHSTTQQRISFGGLASHGYTLLEFDMDTLELKFSKNSTRVVHIPFERGKSYYFQLIGSKEVSPAIKEVNEREFLLLICFQAFTYRRYSLNKNLGLQLLEQE